MSVQTAHQTVKFIPLEHTSFYDSLRKRVDEYFIKNNISKNYNFSMLQKTIAMLAMYLVPYFLIVTGVIAGHTFLFFGLWIIMGFGVTGIGASVMHDSCHGAYSHNHTVNSLLGGTLNLLGGYSKNWKIQHNILHHTYTNIDGLDEDIDSGAFLRMSPNQKIQKIHKYQYIYAWFFYSLMNLYWVLAKDYKCLFKYHKLGLLKKQKISLVRGILEVTFYRAIYIFYLIYLPYLFSGFSIVAIIGGYVIMQMVAGFTLACVFQLAHVMEECEFPIPSSDHKINNNWAVHQVLNTADFSPNSKFLSWYIGGLNFQIEHHLFPHICHIHYKEISKIVKATVQEYGLPYNVQPTFLEALKEHARMLKKLGTAPAVVRATV